MIRRRTTTRALLLAATLLGAPAAMAQTVPVRAGEHDTFTRLVLRVPDPGSWRLESAPGGFELRGPAGTEFDTDEVFDRIPRDRVTALVPRGDGRLGVLVDCDCHGEAFVAAGVGFVVDILNGPPPTSALAPGGQPTAALPPPLPLPFATQALPFGARVPLAGAHAAPFRTQAAPFGTQPQPAGRAPVDDLASTLFSPPNPVDQAREADRVARTEAAIRDSVAAAASQGLLDLASPQGDEPTGVTAPGLDLSGRPGVAFRTGSEGPEGEGAPMGNTGAACLPDEMFDLAAWAGTGDFSAELPKRIAALADGRDRLDPEAGEDLARTYLAFGFGREAGVALDLTGQRSRERDLLRVMARLIDGEPVPTDALEDQAGCVSPVALWRALARDSVRATGEPERIALTLALRELPDPARAALTLRLAGIFLQAGDPAAAEAIADMHDGTGTEAVLARAEIALERDEPGLALAELATLAVSDARMTPDAMATLLDLSVSEGRPVGEDMLALSQSLRFEYGEEATRRLLLSEARTLVAQARYEDALALLSAEQQARPGEDIDAALTDAVAALTEGLDDAPFVEMALSGLPAELPVGAREVAARRLYALGFPNEAWEMWMREPSAAEAPSELPALTSPTPEPVRVEELSPAPAASPSPASSPVAPPEAPAPLVMAPAAAPEPVPPVVAPAAPEPVPVATEPAPILPTPTTPPVTLAVVPQQAGLTDPLPGIVPLVAPETASPPPSEPPAAVAPEPIPVAQPALVLYPDPAPGGMTLAERRELLAQAEEARTRAAALLEATLPAGD
jgi:hypothetical protein